MRFEFTSVPRIVFGAGTFNEVGAIARAFGRRALVITGAAGRYDARLAHVLQEHELEHSKFEVGGEPTVAVVHEGVRQFREARADFLIALGGGSVLDAGKAIAALHANGGELKDYLEVVGHGKALSRPSTPWLAVPTTAGTGAEVTRNAVLGVPEHQVKASLRSPFLLSKAAIVDPELTHGLPPHLTAFTGLDALTQLIEPYVSPRHNPMTDCLCQEGLRRCARSLRRVFEAGGDAAAREDMALASLFGGLALANSGLGTVHGFASAIGGAFAAPHGAVCASLLPHVTAANLNALQDRQPQSQGRPRYDEIARLLIGQPEAAASDGVEWIKKLCGELKIPKLRTYGIEPSQFPSLVEKTARASSTKNNPIVLTTEELTHVLESAW